MTIFFEQGEPKLPKLLHMESVLKQKYLASIHIAGSQCPASALQHFPAPTMHTMMQYDIVSPRNLSYYTMLTQTAHYIPGQTCFQAITQLWVNTKENIQVGTLTFLQLSARLRMPNSSSSKDCFVKDGGGLRMLFWLLPSMYAIKLSTSSAICFTCKYNVI